MQLYKIEEVAEQLGASKQQVTRLLASEELPAIDISASAGRHRRLLRVRADDLEAFLEKRRVSAPVQCGRRRRRRR